MNRTHEAKNWREVVKQQGRTLTWLAKATGTSVRSVYAYSSGQNRTPDDFLAKVSAVLGEEVTR